ncbi:MAG: flagellar motor protein MotB [Planctomycetota bacterium]
MGDEPEEMGIPEWVVTFGDMMSLLLTFFIMLVSLSEIKEEEKFQALVDSMQRSFGYQRTLDALAPGDARPRTSKMAVLSTTGRAKKKDTAKGGVPQKAPVGEEPRVRIIRPGKMTAVGTVIDFTVGSDELSDQAKRDLDFTAAELRGKPQKIEVRGHASSQFASRTENTDEDVMLGIRRARAVLQYLVKNQQLDPKRFRISSAGSSEPTGADGSKSVAENPRVEVFLTDERINTTSGNPPSSSNPTLSTQPENL